MKRFIVTLLLATLASAVADAKEKKGPNTSFHDRVVATYNFLPRNLSEKEIDAKSNELDVFWNDVKARGPQGLEDLRAELRRSDAPVFFNYDGAKLLLSLSDSREDSSLALAAINRTELRDLQWSNYFFTIHSLAVKDLDTSDAALKILSEEKFQVFVPQHFLTLGQDFCLLYLLLPTDEAFYLDKIALRLFEEKNITAQKSLLMVLLYSATKKGDEAVRRFAEDRAKPEASRSYARAMMDSVKMARATPLLGWTSRSYDELKAERKKLMARVSDEALHELEGLQIALWAKSPR
jgi:hypothetical protein